MCAVYHAFGDPDDPDAEPPTPGVPQSPLSNWDPADHGLDSSPVPGLRGGGSSPAIDPASLPFEPISLDTVAASLSPQRSHDDRVETPMIAGAKIQHLLSSNLLKKKEHLGLVPITNSQTVLKTVPREDLFPGHPDRERLIGRLEGILIGHWHGKEGLPLEKCYALCDVASPDEILRDMFSAARDLAEGHSGGEECGEADDVGGSGKASKTKKKALAMRGGKCYALSYRRR